jgi:hypothetical protein
MTEKLRKYEDVSGYNFNNENPAESTVIGDNSSGNKIKS